jgi:hypothetical protein
MEHIMSMMFLGILAGLVAGFFTRIIKSDMILRSLGHWIDIRNNRHLIEHATDSLLIKFIKCMFCITVWLVFLLEAFYIVEYTPFWTYAAIGVLGGLGAGNLVCEVIYAIRTERE